MPNSLNSCFSHFSKHQTQQEDLLKNRFLWPTPRISDSIVLGWDLRIYISNKFPRDAAAGADSDCKIHVFEEVYVRWAEHDPMMISRLEGSD